MKRIEEKALAFMEELKRLYFYERDIDGFLSYMDEKITVLNSRNKNICFGTEKMKMLLLKDKERYSGAFFVENEECKAQAVSEDTCFLFGIMHAVPKDCNVKSRVVYVTFVCKLEDEGFKVIHCNFSYGALTEEDQKKEALLSPTERLLIEELQERKNQLWNLTKYIPGGAHQCMNDEGFTFAGESDSFLEMFGYTQGEIKELFDNQYINMIYPVDRTMVQRKTKEQLKNGDTIEIEYRVMCKDGRPMWILDKSRLMKDSKGRECFYCILIEITEWKKEQEELRLSLERHQVIMDQATDIIFEWDLIRDTVLFSPNWYKKFGYAPVDWNFSKEILQSENIHEGDKGIFLKLMKNISNGVPYSESEFRIRDEKGKFAWFRVRSTTQFDHCLYPVKAIGVISDIDAEKTEKMELLEMAEKDELTGIYNRTAMKIQIEQRIRHANNGLEQALLIIDVDNFKYVNDKFGHICGDQVLADAAKAIRSKLRSSDLVGRIGGDEFIVYLPDVANRLAVVLKAEMILEGVRKIQPANHPNVPITCSIGVVISNPKEMDYATLYKCADSALYRQKNIGKNGVSLYEPYLDAEDSLGIGICEELGDISAQGDSLGMVDDRLVHFIFRILNQADDAKKAVDQLLEIIGRSFDVSRVYILEIVGDGYYSNTFEWCAEGISAEKDVMQRIPMDEAAKEYLDNFNENGLFFCDNIQVLKNPVVDLLQKQGTRSMLQCKIMNQDVFRGIIGFDECRENRIWSKKQAATLALIANVLSVFLTKLRLEENLKRLREQ